MAAYQVTYQIRVIQNGKVISRRHLGGLGKNDAAVIKAQVGQLFVIADTLGVQNAPQVRMKRVGKNLQLALENGNPDIPDLIIEGFFNDPSAQLMGMSSEGSYVNYNLSGLTETNPNTAASNTATSNQARDVAAPTTQDTVSSTNNTPTKSGVVSSNISNSDGWSTLQMTGLAGLGIVALAGAASGGGNDKKDTPTAASVQLKIQAYADDGSKAAPTVDDYKTLGVTGVTDQNLVAINNAIDALTGTNVDSKAKVQAIIDAYVKILAEANGTNADATPANPSIQDYQLIGVNLGNIATQPSGLLLYNDVIGAQTTTGVDTIAELDALAVVVNKIMLLAEGGSAALTVDDLKLIGLPTTGSGAVTSANLSAVINAIKNAGGQAGVDTLAELNALVLGMTVLFNYASDGTLANPVLSNYTGLGITGVTTANLGAINSAIDSLSGAQVDSKIKVQAIVDAYIKILAEANGTTADATPGVNPSAADYALIGANIGLATTNGAALNLLNETIGNLSTQAVDTIAEINALAAVVTKVIQTANGQASTLTLDDLFLLGLPSSGAGAINANNFGAVIAAIANAGGQNNVDTFKELSGLTIAVATIYNYADDSTQAAPTLANYQALGINNITASNFEAINSAIEANTSGTVDTKAEVQAIVDAYSFILAEANGSISDQTPGVNPTAAQYALIGANIGAAATDAENLSLLNDSLAGLQTTAVDTVTEINALAAAANAVMTCAAGGAGPSLAQLQLLGVTGLTGLTAEGLAAIQAAIVASNDDGTQVDTMAELNALVTKTLAALAATNTIKAYADDNTAAAPSLSDYTAIGITGVSSSNLLAINSSIDALVSADVDTSAELQAIVNAYTKILAEANGASADATPGDNPSANDYKLIGANIGIASLGTAGGTDLASSALNLLDNSISGLTTTSVNSVAKINALAAIIDKIMNLAQLATGDAIPTNAVSMAELASLGLNVSLVNTTAETNAIWQAIINSADDGSGVMTIATLQSIINANAS